MTVIPIVIGTISTVTKGLIQGLEGLIIGLVVNIQTSELLRSARTLRRVLDTWGDLLSLRLQWKNHQLTLMWKIHRDSVNNRCILQPEPTATQNTRWVESYPSAEIQSVYSAALADWATIHSLGESYSFTETQSVYSAAIADWATGHLLGESYPFTEMQSVYSAAPADWASGWLKIRGRSQNAHVSVPSFFAFISHLWEMRSIFYLFII